MSRFICFPTVHTGHPLRFYSESFLWIHLFFSFILLRILWSPFCCINTLPRSHCATLHIQSPCYSVQGGLGVTCFGRDCVDGFVFFCLFFYSSRSLFFLYFFHSRELTSSSMPAAWTTSTPQPSARDWPMGRGRALARCSAACEWETRRTRSTLYVTRGPREPFVCVCVCTVYVCVCALVYL